MEIAECHRVFVVVYDFSEKFMSKISYKTRLSDSSTYIFNLATLTYLEAYMHFSLVSLSIFCVSHLNRTVYWDCSLLFLTVLH